MIYLEKNNLEELINNDICLVDFYADWCGPCKMMDEVLNEIDNEINIIKVNTDKFPKIIFKYRIMSIPTIILFKDGKKVQELVGFQSKETLLNEINKLKNS